MKTIYKCSMSKSIKWISAIILILLLATIVSFLYVKSENQLLNTIIVLLLLFLIFLSISLYPKYVILTDDGIGIHTLFRTKWIKYDNVKTVERVNISGSIRICGIGGFLGCIGLYRNPKIGKYLSYVTDMSKVFVVYRQKGLPVALSVADPDSFQSKLLTK